MRHVEEMTQSTGEIVSRKIIDFTFIEHFSALSVVNPKVVVMDQTMFEI